MTDHINTLRQYNLWRRGTDESIPMIAPAVIGVAIDATIAEVERLRSAMNQCYLMLLTESDTKAALSKAENILREAGAK